MGKKGINFRNKNGNYNNGRSNERGYIKIKAYTHPFAPKNKYIRFHRYVLEIYYSIKFGIPIYILSCWFDIHHINRNRSDNRIENLKILTKSDHTILTNKTERIYKQKHDNTICLLCNSKTTYKDKKGYYHWSRYKDDYICKKCKDILNKKPYKRTKPYKKKRLKRWIVKPVRICFICKTNESVTNNRSMWYKYKNFDICIKCNGYKRRKKYNPFLILDIIKRYYNTEYYKLG